MTGCQGRYKPINAGHLNQYLSSPFPVQLSVTIVTWPARNLQQNCAINHVRELYLIKMLVSLLDSSNHRKDYSRSDGWVMARGRCRRSGHLLTIILSIRLNQTDSIHLIRSCKSAVARPVTDVIVTT